MSTTEANTMSGRKLPTPACLPAIGRTPRNTAPTALPSHRETGVTQSRLLSPTTQLVEHPGNPGRPHADADRAHPHLLPVDRWPIRRARLLTRQPHTAHAGTDPRWDCGDSKWRFPAPEQP